MAQYKAVTLDLAKTKIAWDKAQNDPKIAASGKAASRPTVRQISPSNPGAGLQKVDKIEFLETKQSKLQEEIVAIRSDEDAQKPSTAGFVTFSSIATANAAAQTLQALAPGTVDVMMAPEPREIFWPGVIMPKLKRAAGGHTVTLLKIPLVWGYILAILFIASMQNLDALTANPGMGWLSFINDLPAAVSGIIQGLVPVILLAVLMSMLPKILRAFAMKSGAVSESEIQTYVFGTHYASVDCGHPPRLYVAAYDRVILHASSPPPLLLSHISVSLLFCADAQQPQSGCRYQVVFVFFLTMLSSAIFASLDVVLADPTQIFSILGETVPGAGNFFIAYVVLQAFGKFPGELARIVPLILQKFFLRSVALDTERMKIMEPGTMDYGTLLPQQLVIYLLVLAYSVLHPIISFFGVIYFGIGLVPHSPSPLDVLACADIPARYIVHTCLADR